MEQGKYEPSLDTSAGDVRCVRDQAGVEEEASAGESFGGIIGRRFAQASLFRFTRNSRLVEVLDKLFCP